MRRIEKITGRSDDMLIVRGVNLFPTQVEELILRVPGLSPHFQLVLSRPKRLDELTVRVDARPDAASADERAGLRATARRPDQGERRRRRRRRARARPDRAVGRQGAARARSPERPIDAAYSPFTPP
jgi:acyl-CoA synthetase (AMP-forming)/AMP-acid ligase II